MRSALTLAAMMLVGCAHDPAEVAIRNAPSWAGASVRDIGGPLGSPSTAIKRPNGTYEYHWLGGSACVDLGYRAQGSSIYRNSACASDCSYEVVASQGGAILTVNVTPGRDMDCGLPARGSARATFNPPIGSFHTDDVTIVHLAARQDIFEFFARCDARFKAGERVWIGQVTGPSGLWPSFQTCCMAPGSATCAVRPPRKSLFEFP